MSHADLMEADMEYDDEEEIIRWILIEYLARRAYFCRDFADKISATLSSLLDC